MKPILVTGATGFLGKHLVEQLLRNGAGPVRVLCRGEGLAGTELVRGDITIASDVERAVSGVRQIYHLAGLVSRNPADTPKMKQIHVEGTRLVCEAALRQGVERVVLASSSGTVAVSREPVEHDERSGYKADVAKNWGYYVTKIEQEMLALRFHRERGLPLLSVNPSLLLGPGDDRAPPPAM
ncbi:MAG: NAD-dependent epimerase/dehydratase family protein [Bryobacteraceae bacterium]